MAIRLAALGRPQKVLAAILLGAAIVCAIFAIKRFVLPRQYQVYSAFIREAFPEWFRDPDTFILPIARDSMTCVGSWLQHAATAERLNRLRKAHPGVSDDLLLRYYSAFLSQEVLSNRFSLPVRTVLVLKEELDCDKNEQCIEDFFKRYPLAPGLLRFSQVAFSSDGQLAMFEYSYELCPLCSHGGTVLMEKKSGRWCVRENFGIWVS